MRVLRVVSGTVLVAILAAATAGLPAAAQPLTQVAGPRELPPAGFTGNQYVDSAGCVFVRAGVGGQTTWVPRVGRDRKLVCGFVPSVAAAPAEAAPEASASASVAAEAAASAEANPEQAAVPTASTAPATPATPAASAAADSAGPAPRTAPATSAGRAVRLVRTAPVARVETLCLARIPAAQRYLLSDGRRVTRCAGAAPEEPLGYLNGLNAPGLTVVPGAPSAAETKRAERADRGAYRVVWQQGEIAGQPVHTSAPVSASAPAGPGGYVQVGVFAEPANAAASIGRLKALGLPAASSTGTKGGRRVKAVMAGPFTSAAELQAALATLRGAGFPDAYIRG